jgi:hypothetical protein
LTPRSASRYQKEQFISDWKAGIAHGVVPSVNLEIYRDVPVERDSVERDDNDLAPVIVIAEFLLLRHVKHGERELRDGAVFQEYGRPLHLVPVILRDVLAPYEIGWVVRQPAVRPVRDAIRGGQVEGLSLAPAVHDDVTHAGAVPDHGVFQVLGR